MPLPALYSKWRYLGYPGGGEIHSVALVDAHEIVTVAMKHAWRGTPEEFLAQFQSV